MNPSVADSYVTKRGASWVVRFGPVFFLIMIVLTLVMVIFGMDFYPPPADLRRLSSEPVVLMEEFSEARQLQAGSLYPPANGQAQSLPNGQAGSMYPNGQAGSVYPNGQAQSLPSGQVLPPALGQPVQPQVVQPVQPTQPAAQLQVTSSTPTPTVAVTAPPGVCANAVLPCAWNAGVFEWCDDSSWGCVEWVPDFKYDMQKKFTLIVALFALIDACLNFTKVVTKKTNIKRIYMELASRIQCNVEVLKGGDDAQAFGYEGMAGQSQFVDDPTYNHQQNHGPYGGGY